MVSSPPLAFPRENRLGTVRLGRLMKPFEFSTAVGTVGWAQVINARQTFKAGCGISIGKIGTGTSGPAANSPVTYSYSGDADPASPATYSGYDRTYFNMDAGETGFSVQMPMSTIARTVDIYLGSDTGQVLITPTLDDNSATLAPFLVTPGNVQGVRFNVQAGTANTFFNVLVTSTNARGISVLFGDAVTVY